MTEHRGPDRGPDRGLDDRPAAGGTTAAGGAAGGDGTDGVLDLARQACAARDLKTAGLRLIRHYSNAVVLVPAEDAVARIAIGPHDRGQVERSVQITRHLAEQGFATIATLPGIDPVAVTDEVTVSFWRYLPQPDPAPRYDSADLARLLAELHALSTPAGDLAAWQPLTSLSDALRGDRHRDGHSDRDGGTAAVLSPAEHRWLDNRVGEVRESLSGRDWPLGTGMIHGDAWLGNLMAGPVGSDGPVLGDWDRVAHGPREVDLIPTWHATRRYSRDRGWTARFVAVYGHDLRETPAFDELMAMRDLAQLPGPLRRAPSSPAHARALRQRLGDLMAGDATSTWFTP